MSTSYTRSLRRSGSSGKVIRSEPDDISVGSRVFSFFFFVVSLALTIFLAGILLTYDKLDAGFSHSSSMSEVHNIFGTPGAWTADLLYLLFGWGAWLFAAAFLVLTFQSWRAFARPLRKASTPNFVRLIMFCILVISACALLFLRFHSYSSLLPGTTGGALGSAIGTELLYWTGLGWSTAICLISVILSAAYVFGFSWVAASEGLGHAVEAIFTGIRRRKEKIEDEQAGQNERKRRGEDFLSGQNDQPIPEEPEGPIIEIPPHAAPSVEEANDGDDEGPIEVSDDERGQFGNGQPGAGGETGDIEEPVPPVRPPAAPKEPVVRKPKYHLPTDNLLDTPPYGRKQEDQANLNIMADSIERILAEYRINVKVLDWMSGPVITLFKVQPAPGITSKRILSVSSDLARGLGQERIRIIENMREIGCIGLEIPNPPDSVETIYLREIIGSDTFKHSKSRLTLALGKNTSGVPVIVDLAKAPHLLVAGTTGSGKSVGINAMILSMLYKNKPDELRLVMIDPKAVEFAPYENIPHLLTPVITDMKEAANALGWAVKEMDKRFSLMKHVGVRKFDDYNEKIEQAQKAGNPILDPFSISENPEPLQKFSYIVIIIDELADLLLTNRKEVENLIMRLAQKARAAGMHMILATQRPSADIVTPIIKTNCPSRISFQVSNRYDSMTIINESGAEELLGNGDMFYMTPGAPLLRVHGAYVSNQEIKALADFARSQGEPNYVDGVTASAEDLEAAEDAASGNVGSIPSAERDVFYDQAVQIVIEEQKASISYLQRRLGIGYNRAAKLIEMMEDEGIVSKPTASGKRMVLAAPTSF